MIKHLKKYQTQAVVSFSNFCFLFKGGHRHSHPITEVHRDDVSEDPSVSASWSSPRDEPWRDDSRRGCNPEKMM